MDADSKAVELYRKHRPRTLGAVVGQEHAVAQLKEMGKANRLPHVILFSGPSGTGKTTISRILKEKLECSDSCFHEINAADSRGIDTVRDIRQRMGIAPIGGKTTIYLIDEAHKLTNDAQNGFLKILEDTPSHVYFFLATTDPQKLIATIKTRCTEIALKPVSQAALKTLVQTVAEKEDKEVADEVADKIAEYAEGSARGALVILHRILGLETKEEQLESIEKGAVKNQSIDLCRALINKTSWKEVAKILEGLKDQEAESIRRHVLGYAQAVLLKSGQDRAFVVLDVFSRHLYDVGFPGLVAYCYAVCTGK
jgi:DNA polymerase III gamma/tau subunit